jgi:hypothetical protein
MGIQRELLSWENEKATRNATSKEMTNHLESSVSKDNGTEKNADGRGTNRNGWVKVGTIAAASAVLGGLAAAWFYRKTLSQLREAENEIADSESKITGDETPEDF